ncbi:3-methyladenine DNA glycosylase [Actibacterium mucosum KCTC 23349]|uniref:3-methyladenine DNA glycosylase n=1 Tax=Actibacterium mucosum KCTC 23349 TaxID=1454373 RepID=A0A037ZNL8_9RHOB|nr:DNA-3-methyladenine glycosylase I [Actibacterium mucosum]KAJ56401.1 3-methyladenine DNA glycosylase [Actibacterium mucosum KCTC 23349]
MRSFDQIYAIAAERHGGPEALEAMLSQPKTVEELSSIPDHRWLSAMARGVFQAGFSWKVIEAKWDGFEDAFEGFEPGRVLFMADEGIDRWLSNKAIVRNGQKISSVVDNAGFLLDLANEHGSAAKAFAEWPDEDYVGLLEFLKKRGSRLGGTTGQYLLRTMGKNSFILSRDVVGRLVAEGVIDKAPTSKKAMAAVQVAFNEMAAESGRSFNEISRVMGFSL